MIWQQDLPAEPSVVSRGNHLSSGTSPHTSLNSSRNAALSNSLAQLSLPSSLLPCSVFIVAGYKLDMRACLQHMSELDQIHAGSCLVHLSAMLSTNSVTHHTVVLLRTC